VTGARDATTDTLRRVCRELGGKGRLDPTTAEIYRQAREELGRRGEGTE